MENHPDFIDWYTASEYQQLSERLIVLNQHAIDKSRLLKYQKLSEEFIEYLLQGTSSSILRRLINIVTNHQEVSMIFLEKYMGVIDWNDLPYKKVPIDFVVRNAAKVRWESAVYHPQMTEVILCQCVQYFGRGKWCCISELEFLTEEFIEKYADHIIWCDICAPMSEEFIERNLWRFEWNALSSYKYLTESFIARHADRIIWSNIRARLSEEFIERWSDKIDHNMLADNCSLSEVFMIQNANRIDWHYVSRYQKMSCSFLARYQFRIDWKIISINPHIAVEQLLPYLDKVSWYKLCIYKQLNENFMAQNVQKFGRKLVSKYQRLSESFIDKFADFVNWRKISRHQKLSEEFIILHEDLIDWHKISRYQCLSEEVITYYSDRVFWPRISKYQQLSAQFIMQNMDKLSPGMLMENTDLLTALNAKHMCGADSVEIQMRREAVWDNILRGDEPSFLEASSHSDE